MSKELKNFKQLPGGTTRPPRTAGKTPGNKLRNEEPTPCRAVVLLLNRHRGIPFSTLTDPEFSDTGIPTEQVMMSVGLFGQSPSGRQFARIGIYSFPEGVPTLRFPIDLDPATGMLRQSSHDGPRLDLRDPDMSAVNWTRGALFSKTLANGTYDFKSSILDRVMIRREFALERQTNSAVEMFNEYMTGFGAGDMYLVMPETIVTYNPLDYPTLYNPSEMGLYDYAMPAESFRRHATNKYVLALTSTVGCDFAKLKSSYTKQFETADAVIDGGVTGLIGQTMSRAISAINQFSGTYLDELHLSEEVRAKANTRLSSCLNCLQAYYSNRTNLNGIDLSPINMWRTTGELPSGVSPTFHSIRGQAVQVIDNYRSNGTLPTRGENLFMP